MSSKNKIGVSTHTVTPPQPPSYTVSSWVFNGGEPYPISIHYDSRDGCLSITEDDPCTSIRVHKNDVGALIEALVSIKEVINNE